MFPWLLGRGAAAAAGKASSLSPPNSVNLCCGKDSKPSYVQITHGSRRKKREKQKTKKPPALLRARDPSWTQLVKGLLQPGHCRIPWKTSLPRHNAPCLPKTEVKTQQCPSPSHVLWWGQVSSNKSQRLIARRDVFSEGQVQRKSWSWGWTNIEKTLWKQFKCPAPGELIKQTVVHCTTGFPGGASGKELTSQCRRQKRQGFDPWSGRCPGGRHGNRLQYSCLEIPVDYSCGATVCGVAKSRTWPKQLRMQAHCTTGCYMATQKTKPLKYCITWMNVMCIVLIPTYYRIPFPWLPAKAKL